MEKVISFTRDPSIVRMIATVCQRHCSPSTHWRFITQIIIILRIIIIILFFLPSVDIFPRKFKN